MTYATQHFTQYHNASEVHTLRCAGKRQQQYPLVVVAADENQPPQLQASSRGVSSKKKKGILKRSSSNTTPMVLSENNSELGLPQDDRRDDHDENQRKTPTCSFPFFPFGAIFHDLSKKQNAFEVRDDCSMTDCSGTMCADSDSEGSSLVCRRVRFVAGDVSSVSLIPSFRDMSPEERRCVFSSNAELYQMRVRRDAEVRFEHSRNHMENVLEEQYFYQDHLGAMVHPAHWTFYSTQVLPRVLYCMHSFGSEEWGRDYLEYAHSYAVYHQSLSWQLAASCYDQRS